ncbi:MAG TPA: hypothetical protein VFB58_18540 [Chloroflexota bacterium]|nr:hypothetical protein [Chloroflexota bacterium]
MRAVLPAFFLLLTALLPANAHAAGSRHLTPAALAVRVGRIFGDSRARIIHLERTTAEASNQRMYVIGLRGSFRQGARHARYLYFSALAGRWHVWGVVAYDARHHVVWNDPILPARSRF